MSLHLKFLKAVGCGLVAATTLAGCGEPPGAVDTGDAVIIGGNCIVIDRDAGPAFRWAMYDFNRDYAQFSLNMRGVGARNSATQVFQGEYSVKISELPEGDGRKRALMMFEKIPADLGCPKPKY